MSCPCEGPKRDKRCQTGTPPVLEVHSKECPVLFHTVVIPASAGDPTTMPPEPGMYRNVRLTYEATGDAYLFDSDGIPQLLANIGPVAQVTSVNGQTGDVVLDAADVNAQAPLTAGANISIDANNEISATDTTYTAGTNITIDSDNVISAASYTAGANVSIDANNVISATDTTYSDFVGTDGQVAGTAGLVPAPATTDAGKFLKADGTWDTVGGGIDPSTTFWGQGVVNGVVDGNINITKGSTARIMFMPANYNKGAAIAFQSSGIVEMEQMFKIGSSWNIEAPFLRAGTSEFKVRPIVSQMESTPIMPTEDTDYTCKAYVDAQVGNIETILQTLNSGTGV